MSDMLKGNTSTVPDFQAKQGELVAARARAADSAAALAEAVKLHMRPEFVVDHNRLTLLDNGHLLRAAQLPLPSNFLGALGAGGRLEEYDWDGTLLWGFDYSSDDFLSHHDVEVLKVFFSHVVHPGLLRPKLFFLRRPRLPGCPG